MAYLKATGKKKKAKKAFYRNWEKKVFASKKRLKKV